MNESVCLLSTLEKQRMKTFGVFYLLFFASSKVIYTCVCVCLSLSREEMMFAKHCHRKGSNNLEGEFQSKEEEEEEKKSSENC